MSASLVGSEMCIRDRSYSRAATSAMSATVFMPACKSAHSPRQFKVHVNFCAAVCASQPCATKC
eukprot:2519508-Alexandrium_andersonii.AAC.1